MVGSPQGNTTHALVHDTIVRWLRDEASLSIDRIDYDASLFEMGIDSLGAATIGCQLEQLTGESLNPEVLYELQTINELADYLDSLRGTGRVDPSRPADSPPQPGPSAGVVGEAEHHTEPGLLKRYAQLNRRVNTLKREGRYYFEPEISRHDGAWVEVNGQRMLMLASYEYLGLLGHPHLRQTAIEAIDRYGTGHHRAPAGGDHLGPPRA